MKARTAQANQIWALLAEFGLVIPQGIRCLFDRVPDLIFEDGGESLPGRFHFLIIRLMEHLKTLDRDVQEPEQEIQQWHRTSEASRRLEAIPGIGPLTASALVAAMESRRAGPSTRRGWLERRVDGL